MPIKSLAQTMGSVMSVALALVFMAAARPAALSAQQSANVLVRVNVISVPVAPAAFDSLTRTMRDTVSADTRARAMAHARERGLRVAITRPALDARGPTRPAGSGTRDGDVLLMEYVAN
jgi:hypothetical protein